MKQQLKMQAGSMAQPMSVEEVKAMLDTTEKGGVRNSIKNCLTVFQHDPLLSGAIAYNLLTDRTDVVKPIGYDRSPNASMTDTDMKYIRLYLEENYDLTSEKKIIDAADLAAHQNSYHPVRDYLNSLTWDGTERIRYCLHHFLGAEADEYRSIRDIKVSDAQKWIMKLHEDGKGYSTLTSVRGVVKPAFQMAYNEDVIRRNPFDFKLVDVVSNDSQKRIAMTEEQQTLWMDFIREDKTYCKYYDEFVVLLGTGMRVSEFCGLTKADLDFTGRKIRVDHQLVRERGGKYYVEKTKTECGCRYIPMTDEVYQSLQNILSRRKRVKTETIIDGYSGFLLLDKNDSPKVALHIENEMRWAMKKYQKLHPDKPLPHITPHVFRHTFCTNMANAGMDIKTLQYVMGHSDVGVTLNVYTHASYDRAAEQMAKIIDFKGLAAPEPQRKSG